jgi:uncharacterized membrane protein HdeD (DUF308 family)
MINPKRVRLSPLDWYKIGSSILFVVLGGFIVVRFIISSQKKYATPLIIGGLIFAYGIYRVIAAFRNLRRVLKNSRDNTD